jgi:hypothetical protein
VAVVLVLAATVPTPAVVAMDVGAALVAWAVARVRAALVVLPGRCVLAGGSVRPALIARVLGALTRSLIRLGRRAVRLSFVVRLVGRVRASLNAGAAALVFLRLPVLVMIGYGRLWPGVPRLPVLVTMGYGRLWLGVLRRGVRGGAE